MAQLDEVTLQLDELDTRLDRLRALFEQYFVGIEKTEPHVQKKDVERRLQVLRKMQLRNTAARFRFQMLVQRYTTYLTYWQRICRQIEEGTFKREAARIQRYGKSSSALRDAEVELSIDDIADATEDSDLATHADSPPAAARARMVEEIPLMRLDSSPPPPLEPSTPRPAAQALSAPTVPGPKLPAPPPPSSAAPRRTGISPFGAAAPKPPPPRRKSSGSMKAVSAPSAPNPSPSSPGAPRDPVAPPPRTEPSRPSPADDPGLRALYERYRTARRQNGEGEVPFDTMAKEVRDTLPRLAERYPEHSVSLDVATKDGKTILRPVVRAKK